MAKKKAALTLAKPDTPPGPTKLDLGCGTRKAPGFYGVDAIDFVGVDQVVDLRQPWPWADGSIDEVYSSHFVEHLTNPERVHFFNELHRVLRSHGKATIIVPHWSNACAYGDPTHQWPPCSEWMVLYLDAQWRAVNAPHAGYTCDFLYTTGFAFDERIVGYVDERKSYMLAHNVNSARDMHITLTKRG